MSSNGELRGRLIRIVGGAAAMVIVVLALGFATGTDRDRARVGPAVDADDAGTRAIEAEAEVFRLDPSATTLAMDTERRPDANVRDLASYRALRAYPGAPPAIPHDVDPAWLRTQTCNTCHARGGWAPEQEAYTPVTPHPHYRNCLQCHVDGAEGDLFVPNDFVAADWPELDAQAMEWAPAGPNDMGSSPPPIPHRLQLRGNCLACHGGPAAVSEVRTTHPERANCRQCHAARDDVGAARGSSAGAGAAGTWEAAGGSEAAAFTREVK